MLFSITKNEIKALDTLKSNNTDMNEGRYYEYAILEEIIEGYYSCMNVEKQLFFKYKEEKDSYEKSECPIDLKSNLLYCFALKA